MNRLARRKLVNRIATLVCLALAVLAALPLLSVIWELWARGHHALTWEFLSTMPTAPLKPGGGILHAIVGSAMIIGISAAIGAPIGLLAGIHLAEGNEGRLTRAVRTVCDAMAGIPSIAAGLFGFALVVTLLHVGFSAWAAAAALSILMIPVVARTTEEALLSVPKSLREASLALGAPAWRTTTSVVLPASWPGVATGLLLSISRIAGETAPLLLTTLTSLFLVTSLNQPIAALPTLIYSYGKSAYPKLQEQAWGAALVLIAAILILNLVVRFVGRKQSARGR